MGVFRSVIGAAPLKPHDAGEEVLDLRRVFRSVIGAAPLKQCKWSLYEGDQDRSSAPSSERPH